MTKVIGLGCGRCGTKSLAYILNKQENTSVTHECAPKLPYVDNDIRAIDVHRRFKGINSRNAELVGDIAFFNLWWIHEAMSILGKDTKIICMVRDREKVVESFIRKCKKNTNRAYTRNFWTTARVSRAGGKKYRRMSSNWDMCFPTLGIEFDHDRGRGVELSMEYTISRYWNFYYETVEMLPHKVLWVNVDELNSREGLNKIFGYLGIENANYLTGIRIVDKMKEMRNRERNEN